MAMMRDKRPSLLRREWVGRRSEIYDEVLQVAGRDAGHARSLCERGGADAAELLASFEGERVQLHPREVGGNGELRVALERRGTLALLQEIAIVLQLHLGTGQCLQ
jgi:hypothetical protein